MKVKTKELIGASLDWAVAKCEGITTFGPPEGRSEADEFLAMYDDDSDLNYSTNWAQGGPIIEREYINLGETIETHWSAFIYVHSGMTDRVLYGYTPLIAAMRCYVASKLGDEVEIPEELL